MSANEEQAPETLRTFNIWIEALAFSPMVSDGQEARESLLITVPAHNAQEAWDKVRAALVKS